MENNTKRFIKISSLIIIVVIIFFILLFFAYEFFKREVFNYIILILMGLTAIFLIGFIITLFSIFVVYTKKKKGKIMQAISNIGLKTSMPAIIFFADLFKLDKDALRNIYIDVNNTIVESKKKKFNKDEILILLPHCLQSSECIYKVTGSIDNCKKCGKCSIGEFAKISEKYSINTAVVTGGTLARAVVEKFNPGVILSVACERDLSSGIHDVGHIPVIGLVNERPNGPCKDTRVDIELFKKKLEEILDK